MAYNLHSDTDPTAKANKAPDGEANWKPGTESDGRLELMSLLTGERGNGTLQKTTYAWFDGIKYTFNWDVELADYISTSAMDAEPIA